MYVLGICIVLLTFLISPDTNAEVSNDKYKLVKPKVRFAVVDKTETLTTEQLENIMQVYSEYEDSSSTQISLLIGNSPDEVSGKEFLTKSSGWAEKRLVIILMLSTKEVGLFWTEALNGSLEGISKNYRAKFEPYLTDGKLYEAALYGSLEIIKILTPEYKAP